MIRHLLLFLMISVPAAAQQTKVMIGGIDQRVPALENQFLAEQLAAAEKNAARAAALLSVERDDHKMDNDRASNLQQWLDLAWPAYAAATKAH